jgi:hypothetical protein
MACCIFFFALAPAQTIVDTNKDAHVSAVFENWKFVSKTLDSKTPLLLYLNCSAARRSAGTTAHPACPEKE